MRHSILTGLVVIILCFCNSEMKISSGGSDSTKHKLVNKTPHRARTTSSTTEASEEIPENQTTETPKIPIKVPMDVIMKRKHIPDISPANLTKWAKEISEKILHVEREVARKEIILEKFKDIKREERKGAVIVEKVVKALDDLLETRARAAEAIAREAERLAAAAENSFPPSYYVFKNSKGLDEIKKNVTKYDVEDWEIPNNCSEKRAVSVENLSHFGETAQVQLDISSVHVVTEVFPCGRKVLPHIYWSEGLLPTFKQNYAQDAMTDFQYFCSAKGFMRHYPAATWNSMFQLQLGDGDDEVDIYDCRLRPWYVAAGGAPRDVVILFDFSGSMVNSSNKVHADQFTATLLNALTDDDQVNVISFNDRHVKSVINCFNNKLVPANHVNSAALSSMLKVHVIKNQTNISWALREAVTILNNSRNNMDRPTACQQAIVILSDSFNENFTMNMTILDPTNRIRLFVIWLHDVWGLRDNSYLYSNQLACSIDGYFADLVSDNDATEQVMQILRVMERPLVHQRKERLRAFSDVYAHVEDPRRSYYYWKIKEDEEQGFRYRELRNSKKQFLSKEHLYDVFMRYQSLETHGYYYDGTEKDYRLQISVSVPVFDPITVENITIELAEEDPRNSTRTEMKTSMPSTSSSISSHDIEMGDLTTSSTVSSRDVADLRTEVDLKTETSRLKASSCVNTEEENNMESNVDLCSEVDSDKEQPPAKKIKVAQPDDGNLATEYPANRLLGVAGVDIPVEHLKLILPYYQLGAGGSLSIIDHRGNIILHDNLKPVFDTDVLRPGYRTVDILDLEQSAQRHGARSYSSEWLEFRKAVIYQPQGKRELEAKYIFDSELRAILGKREYHWKRVKEHYTVVVSLPSFNKLHAVPRGEFTQLLASKSLPDPLKDITVHPDWLYCKHVDQHFDEPESEVRHFVMRRRDEPNFQMKNLHHVFPNTPFPPPLLNKTYMCNEELIARLCHEAIATEEWMEAPVEGHPCSNCELGSLTVFFASESGLTRWMHCRMTSAHAAPPPGDVWARGPSESWYKRAVATPGKLVIHAPVTPVRKLRNTFKMPPPFTEKDKWLTAARTLGYHDKGTIGVIGFHFYPTHLEDILRLTTNNSCPDDDKACALCDGENWVCVLIDESGWIVAGDRNNQTALTEEDPIREHLARAYPHAMKALLEAQIFELNWIYDYQAICFPPEKETVKSAATMIPTILKSLWRSVSLLLHVTKEVFNVIALISTGRLVAGDTEFEKQKRRNATRRNFERVKYENLFDKRVEINRTHFAACDRARPLYVLQENSLSLLKRPPRECSWPLTGVEVPETNLMLLAINRLCPTLTGGTPVPDPFVNMPVNMNGPEWEYMTSAANLACWRNRLPLPVREPPTTCFPHKYEDEEGYRQCGPWLPDPPKKKGALGLIGHSTFPTMTNLLLFVMSLHFLVIYCV